MSPFLRPDSGDIRDLLADGAVAVVAQGGVLDLTVSALARWAGMTPPALTQRFPGPNGARRRILRLVTVCFGRRWLAWCSGPAYLERWAPALPESAEERDGVRTWLALQELAASERASGYDEIAAAVRRVHDDERHLIARDLARRTGQELSAEDAALVCACLDGLRRALVREPPTLALGAARAALDRLIAC